MRKEDTDRAWDKFGTDDPYYGVLSHARFRQAAVAGPIRDEFFSSGVAHVNRVLALVEQFSPGFRARRALDFGCGVGRLVLPLAQAADEVIGVDVSTAMLAEAKRNCDAAGVRNVQFVRSDDQMSELQGSFDLVHSFIVFQHIPVARGMQIASLLVDRLADRGIGVLHFTYRSEKTFGQRIVRRLTDKLPAANMAINLLRGRPLREPAMQMNDYPLADILLLLQQGGCHRLGARFSNHAGHSGVVLIFEKARLHPF